MNEKRIQQVLEIERQAQELYDKAVQNAQQLPVQAEQESQAILDKARVEAEAEAQQLIAKAEASQETTKILTEAENKNREMEALVMTHFDRAVNYIFDRVIGRE
ncbi:MAG TPA: hypothetical protein VMT73_13325 [Anaerolineales bacterium]|nr:hypothetical protein [Anaerolineales bacterium]